MSEAAQKLNSNPEILLKKRKNADRLRLEKQKLQQQKALQEKRRKQEKRKSKFIRAETLVAKHRSSERERTRIQRVTLNERQKQQLISNGTERSINDNEDEDQLAFVVRVPGPHGAKVPSKAQKVLRVLRLQHNYQATFIKLNATVRPLLRLVNPYIVIGEPSLATVRELIQKRGSVLVPETTESTETQEDGCFPW
ncbi:unnamed protein product [Ambrosiozyma monospora]|uniref:Ribosome biogenesis protein RLP7 n=1 Tax=Ambrosiozyma monospora TaxID=43982 RepID=A0A9W6Z0F9_AMBMO|nr:unnamed protein product [Ambrosiozyma monospora]